MQSVFDAGLLLLHFGLGRCAHVDDRHPPGQLGQAFLQFFAVVIRGGFLDLAADLVHAALDFGGLTIAFDNGGVLAVDHDVLGAAEVVKVERFQLDTEVIGDALAAGEDRDVFEHRLATITKPRGFDSADVQRAAELVHHQCGQRFAFHFLSDDQQRLADLGNLFEDREQVLQRADLLFVDQDVRVLELALHRLGIGDEIGREIALVELHAFDDFERGFDRLGFLNRDGAVLADLVHGIGDDFADLRVPVRRNRGHLFDFLFVFDLLGDLVEMGHRGFHGFADAALNADRVPARGDKLQAFAINRFGQHGCSSGAIAGGVAGLAGDFAHHLRAHVFVAIFQLDFLGYRDTVLGDGR